MKKTLLFVVVVSLISVPLALAQSPTANQPASSSSDTSSATLANAPFRNPSLPLAERVDDLVSHMTLEEKVEQMMHVAPAIPRLGVPEYNWWSEGLHGVANTGYATVFPQAIGLAASFDTDLIHMDAGVVATEFRAKYNEELRTKGFSGWFHGLTVWSPNINIFRDPRWGRGQETYGEDPFLSAQMGVAFVTGLQGDDPKYLVALSTPKHFAVHSGPESTRHVADVTISNHDLEDTYLPAFRATVLAGAGSVMCAYNAIDGKPACAQPMLLQEHLRDDWDFRGYVVSDCGAASDITEWLKAVQEVRGQQTKLFDYLLSQHPTDFTMLVQSCEDRVGHWLYPIQPHNVDYNPKINAVAVDAFADQYRSFDKVLGVILKHVDDNTYVFVISDHGIKPLREFEEDPQMHMDHGGTTPVIAKHDFADGDDVPGTFIVAGPGIKRDQRLMGFQASVCDVAPTLLHIYGVQAPKQMRGRVLSEIFENGADGVPAVASELK
jgi:beta-glucosidase-like glycosyl hydrolase